MEKLVRLLIDKGCRDITIGEGTPLAKELESDTTSAFKFAGMNRVAKQQYGVKLVDFEKGPFERIEMDGHRFSIVKAALEADFLINKETQGLMLEVWIFVSAKGHGRIPMPNASYSLGTARSNTIRTLKEQRFSTDVRRTCQSI
jgi:hypothetical protein